LVVEDLKRGTNKDNGPKDIFEMPSNIVVMIILPAASAHLKKRNGMSMRIDLIKVPYDLGTHDAGTGQGPGCIARTDVAGRIRKKGHTVREHVITVPAGGGLTDTQLTFQLNTMLSKAVSRSTKDRSFPIVLAGNCITAVGTLSGLHSQQIGVLWLDAHGDFNTPETTQSGYLDGMALSIVCGNCWGKLAAMDPLYRAIPEKNIFLIGARDLDNDESMALEKSQIKVITSEQLRKNDCKSPDLAKTPVQDFYIHLDADVIDAGVGHANRFASRGGLLPEEVEKFFSWVAGKFRVRALAITAYNPEFDRNKNIESAITDILLATVEAISNNGLAT